MVNNVRYALKYRRRREGRTNYKKRLTLLKGRKPRVVVRGSNANMTVQVVTYDPDGDKVVASASTLQLKKLGWKHATGNIPASYLAGFAAGAAAKKAGVKEAIIDLGMQRSQHGGRLFAAVKGVADAGVNIPIAEDALPSEDRISGKHIAEGVSKSVEALKTKVGK